MRRRLAVPLGLAATLLLAGAALAAQLSFNVRPGLWRLTVAIKTAGAGSISQQLLEQVPPAQRAKVEAAMRSVMTQADAPHTYMRCLTAQDLRTGAQLTGPSNRLCHRSIEGTSRDWHVHMECGGKTPSIADYRFKAPDREHIVGTLQTRATRDGTLVTAHGTVSGTWVRAACSPSH